MKDQKISNNKTKAAIVLLVVMVLILLSNFYRLQNSKRANEDINAIFNDRLVVANYIFQYTNDLHSIKAKALETKLNDAQKDMDIGVLIQHINSINDLYLQTVLTPNEKTSFALFLASCSNIEINSQNDNWPKVNQYCDQGIKALKLLSQIQVNEGKSKLEHSNSIHRENTTWGELQIALLIVLGGIALYLLIAKKKKIKVKIPESPSMN